MNLREDRMDGNRCTDRTAGEQGARERDDSMEEKADSWAISRMGVQMNKSQSHEPLGNLRDDGADGVVVAVVVLDADVQVVTRRRRDRRRCTFPGYR